MLMMKTREIKLLSKHEVCLLFMLGVFINSLNHFTDQATHDLLTASYSFCLSVYSS